MPSVVFQHMYVTIFSSPNVAIRIHARPFLDSMWLIISECGLPLGEWQWIYVCSCITNRAEQKMQSKQSFARSNWSTSSYVHVFSK